MGVVDGVRVTGASEKDEKDQKDVVGRRSGIGEVPRVVARDEWEGEDRCRGVCAVVFEGACGGFGEDRGGCFSVF